MITVLLSSVHTPASVKPSTSALTVGYQFGASFLLAVGGLTVTVTVHGLDGLYGVSGTSPVCLHS
ncbi:hypothetical protein [Lactobacillus equicursoris]|uniref:hypothetical protein n=1 Tax=Lactobacillus equicursoris TaxID=420645 RepID=UPI001F3EBB9D|nr:hypothetical protein [Lactobacillus equicursoris]